MRCSVFTVLSAATTCLSLSGMRAGEKVDFANEVRPILSAKCTGCHGGVKQAGGVSFIFRDQVVDFEGESGNLTVVAGDLDASELFYRITTDDETDQMPPRDEHPEGMTEEEIDIIKRWIEQGADWGEHWSFRPIENAQPERNSAFATKAQNDIDHFIFEALATTELAPSDKAHAGRLLRRLSLDLTGIPPTIDQLDAFETAFARSETAAVEAAVDRLLNEKAFGEKWASMWLDTIRYADSRGLGVDRRRTVWPYRDWIIRSFNKDLPFDQFTTKQLAGDLLPNPSMEDLIATAAHRNTQTNEEGGTDDEEFRIEAVMDRMSTTWQTWGAMTFGCVQCHDHPYEPFRHDEYFEFMSFFNNTADSDISGDKPVMRVPLDPGSYENYHQLEQRRINMAEKLWSHGMAVNEKTKWITPADLNAVSEKGATLTISNDSDGQAFYHLEGAAKKADTYHLSFSAAGGDPITALRLKASPKDLETGLRDSDWGFLITSLKASVTDVEGNQLREIEFAASLADTPTRLDDSKQVIGPNGRNWGVYTRINHERWINLIPTEPISLQPREMVRLSPMFNSFYLASFPMVIRRGTVEYSNDPAWTDWAANDHRIELRKEFLAISKEQQKVKTVEVPIMQERPDRLSRPTHVFARGNFLTKEHQVGSGLPDELTKTVPFTVEGDQPTRLDMARWWTDPRHPLTARVFVNRIWQQIFGVGLVATLEDFGTSGEKPSHPELLDYLAHRYIHEHGWQMKPLIRDIVTSYAYQQASHSTELQKKVDPANRLLSRGPRTRLNAEAIRDNALAVGGLLSTKAYGQPVHPPIPTGVWKPFVKDEWDTPKKGDPDRYRRSLYTYMKRSIPFPTFATFDAPSREFCAPRRLNSNTPLQALFTLNDETFAEAAAGLARVMKYQTEGSLAQRLDKAHRLSTGRPIPPGVERELTELFQTMEALYAEDPSLKKDFAGTPDGAAYTVVAKVLLNLDESFTK